MEKKQETRKTKSLTQKAKKIRSVVMMTLLCVLLMSAATYAWFTLSNTAKVGNMTMTVGDVTGLQIAPDNNGSAGEYGSVIDMTNILKGDGVLLPATSTDGKNFLEPIYDDNGQVKDVKSTTTKLPLISNGTDKGYYIEYKFWLKSLGNSNDTVDIKLKRGTNIPEDGKFPSAEATQPAGTYVLNNSEIKDSIQGSAAVRMSFVPEDSDSVAVYEPNNDIEASKAEGSSTRARDIRTTGKTPIAATIPQKKDGEIVKSDTTYKNIVSLQGGMEKQITLYIWIEGTDAQCSNEIAMKNLKAQLQFTTDTDPNTTTTN